MPTKGSYKAKLEAIREWRVRPTTIALLGRLDGQGYVSAPLDAILKEDDDESRPTG